MDCMGILLTDTSAFVAKRDMHAGGGDGVWKFMPLGRLRVLSSSLSTYEICSSGPKWTEDRLNCLPKTQQNRAPYDQGDHVLMQYVWITRPIYMLDRMETAEWAERYRRLHPEC